MLYVYVTWIGLLCGSVIGAPANVSQYDSAAYCNAYCDTYGYYQPAKWCVSQDSSVEVYCCGSQHHRYCCSDQDKDVGGTYPPVKSCPNSSWWHYQWKVIIGLLGTLVVMLMFAACCYYCCGGDTSLPSRSRFMRRRRQQDNQRSSSSPYGENNMCFDPESPHAFTPPDYDSLPKDPPKYADICSVDQGVSADDSAPLANTTQAVDSSNTACPPPEYTPHNPQGSQVDENGNADTTSSQIIEEPANDVIAETEAEVRPSGSEIDSSVYPTTHLNSEASDITIHQAEHSVNAGVCPAVHNSMGGEQGQLNCEQGQTEIAESSTPNDVTTGIPTVQSLPSDCAR